MPRLRVTASANMLAARAAGLPAAGLSLPGVAWTAKHYTKSPATASRALILG